MIASFRKLINNSTRHIHYLRDTTKSQKILTPGCLKFIEELTNENYENFINCIELRNKMNNENKYGFRDDTKDIREDNSWKADEIPYYLKQRHVEITGPGNNSKMVINAFNSGADGYMLDLEDSMTPTWFNVINGHHNIKEASRGTLKDFKYDNDGNLVKEYTIQKDNQPTFFVRTRGLHMFEENVLVNDKPVPATIFDIATHMYHNAKFLSKKGRGPYLYIPKLELYEEANLINDILIQSQVKLGIPVGTAKVTCLIETFPAIFQTEEIIYALRRHIVGLNCGRWDYLFSMIKSLDENKILPYRDELTMEKPFLEAYVRQIVRSCHKRGITAIGGMSAFIPTGDKNTDAKVLNKISEDKVLEIERGCDGAWVAHPGLVKPMKDLFNDKLGNKNQIEYLPQEEVTEEMLLDTPKEFHVTNENLKSNINISLQYIAAWLSGNGAVALNGLMEDLATSEISVFQLKQWLNNRQEIIGVDTKIYLDETMFKSVLEKEFKNMVIDNQVRYADRYYELSKKILLDYVLNKNDFLPDIGTKYLNIDNGFESIRWNENTYKRISGTRGYVSGLELTKIRGEYLNKYLYEDNNPAYKFLGTSNGVSAVNVVAGGNGKVGPYAGGWQHNAMGNRLNMCLPDTLHVAPEESANCAAEINNHLHRADAVQNILKLDNPEMKTVEYYDMAMLCDLEQGWCTPEKTRIATLLAIQNGINVIHIEDQGEKKRCGHLGDKELNTYDDYALIMRSANLAAQELLGPEQADKKWVRFVARTDALSAKRIHNSSKLQDENNPEHKFVDWERGTSPDGKYLYLKQGINEETGNPWGLDLSIYRGARIIDEGLATHVWMETPDADLSVAKKHMDGINEILLPKGKRAQSLYNHSPSFDWDVKFYAEAKKLSKKIINWSKKSYKQSLEFNIEIDDIHRYLCKNGDFLQGDHLFSKEELSLIRSSLRNFNVDLESFFQGKILQDYNGLHSNEISNYALKKSDILEILNKDITDTIVERRLKNFGNQLSTLGCNMHLITLPEFHVTAYNMHLLSKDFSVNGINAFVKGTQRPERIHSERDYTYNYYKHQTATGTGVEAAFNVAVGSHDVNTLNDSTEQDDLKKRDN